MGNCVSSSQKQTKRDAGISSTTYPQTTNKKPVNRFHENDSVVSSATKVRKAKVVRPKKKIHKGLIGLPSNFQHTGHIGITELRSGKVDPEKIKNQMAEVAAALSLEGLNIGSPTPSTPINNETSTESTPSEQHPSEQHQIVADNNNNSNIPQNNSQFKVKRKPTLTPVSSPVQQNSRPSSPSSLSPIVDPMAEIVAALKMPVDGNFDKQNNQKLVA